MVIAAPFGITTSISRDARAAAAPAAAPAAPPITAPFVFFPSSLPTIAPATAPPATLAASAFVTPRPFMTVSIATTERSEEHTSELQSQSNLVCRLLLEKKNKL